MRLTTTIVQTSISDKLVDISNSVVFRELVKQTITSELKSHWVPHTKQSLVNYYFYELVYT